jgi:hypothetical protein
MNDKPFKMPVIVDLGSGADRDVKSVKEALDILSMEWPGDKRGILHAEAVQSCRLSLDGRLPVKKAREAFSAAAWDADIFVSDMRRLSEAS